MKRRAFLIVLFGLHAIHLPAEVRYQIVPILPPAGIDSVGMGSKGVNDHGVVVGLFGYYVEDPEVRQLNRGFIFTNGSHAVELDWRPGFVTGVIDINDAGQLAVNIRSVPLKEASLPWRHETHRFTPGIGFEFLGDFGGVETEAEAINARGQVTGYSEDAEERIHAFRYTDGIGMETIGTNFTSVSHGFAINDQGWVAGYGDGHAFLFRDDLGTILIEPGRAYGINNRGTVVGISWTSPLDRAFIYRDGKVTVVGPENANSYFLDVNNYDAVVGAHIGLGAILWNEIESIVSLSSQIPQDSGWLGLGAASAINDHGQITGWGVFEGQNIAYRLDPIPPKLSITMSQNNAVVSWAPAWPGLVLESSTSLSLPQWQPVPTGGSNQVELPLPSESRYFRLNLEGIRGLCCAPE